MRVGIYLPGWKPEDGGAGTLMGTIYNEIIESKNRKFDFVIFFRDKNSKRKSEQNGIEFINLDKFFSSNFFLQKGYDLYYELFSRSLFNEVAKQEKIDIFYFPYPAAFKTDYPHIATIWDLGHREYPYFPEVSIDKWGFNKREQTYQNMVYKASYIITGNQQGKKEILENYCIPEKKIRIIPFPVSSFCYGEATKPDFIKDEQFFFYPAQFWAHKNHICILDALKCLKKEHNYTPKMIFTGSDKGNLNYIKAYAEKSGIVDQVIFTGFISDGELKYLYRNATAMVYASLMGPNNMPPIEATFLNCPVIITDLDGHKEQLKDSALYFNGLDSCDLAQKMYDISFDDNRRKEIKDKESKMAEKFGKVNYFDEVTKILDEFALIRRTWE